MRPPPTSLVLEGTSGFCGSVPLARTTPPAAVVLIWEYTGTECQSKTTSETFLE